MEDWAKLALIAAIFIAIRDIISYDVIKRLNYIDYLFYANIIVSIGLIIYITLNDVKINKVNTSDLLVILIRIAIVYIITEPSMFYSIKTALYPGYAKAIINLNTIFVLLLSIVFLKIECSLEKVLGILIVTYGSYLVIK